ncbi:AMP-binding protein [Piscibacillus salipiscarius]|uniref:AMP-binding protein n=1 Tax=Piscibacillus salipiscarius TaxID=299480 RepID=UPI0034E2442A
MQERYPFWYTDMGWMMGPFLVYGGLINGASILMFEGTPDYPTPSRIWEIVDRHKVTHLGISPTLIRSIMNLDESYVTKNDLSSLKMIGSTGEPWNEEPWLWLFDKVCKRKVPIFNYSGGTEISGGILVMF